ncbi:MAG: hypothetical protein R2816_04210 [Flavobacteriaceae bacterium]|nr:hypothetical protein [Flavobacteriaceae bacterium]
MAPIKFEEQFKEKLEKRSIQPSQDAWNKLSKRLDKIDNRQNNKGFWWLGIAAAIVGVLLALTFVFKSNTEIVEPTVADTEKENIMDTEVLQNKEVLKESNTLVVEHKDITETKNNLTKNTNTQIDKALLKTIVNQKQETLIKEADTNSIAVANANTAETTKPNTEKAVKVLSFEDQKVKDVVAQIQQLQKDNKEITTEEIDALLEVAQKEITMQKLYNEATNKVDANALLESVEYDLEQSFRAKVFDAIKSGYESVKTALAERNN